MRKMRWLGTGRPAVLGMLFCVVVLSLSVLSGCGEQLARMEENQVKLQAMIAANARQLATLSTQIENGDAELKAAVQDLDAEAERTAVKLAVIQEEQLQLHAVVAAGNQRADKGIAQIEDDQRSLRDDVAQLSETMGRTSENLTALAGNHAALHEMVRANQQELGRRIATVAGNQQRIETGVTELQQTGRTLTAGSERLNTDLLGVHTLVETLSAHLTALANEQTLSHAGQRDSTRALAQKVAMVESNQQNIQVRVDETVAVARQTAADVTALTDGQAAMREAVRVSRDVLTGQMAAGLQEQQAIQTSVQDLHGKVDTGVDRVIAGQAALRERLGTNHNRITTAMVDLSRGQEEVRDQLGILTATASQTGLDVLAVNDGQTSLQAGLGALAEQQAAIRQDMKESDEAVAARMNSFREDGGSLKTAVNQIGARTQQTAAGITEMAAAQHAARQAFDAQGRELGIRLHSLADGQEQLQDRLGILTATAGQTAIDVIAIADGQQALQTAVRNQGASADSHAATLADTQTQIQDSLGILTATVGQTALDVIGLSDGQTDLEQAVQTNGRTLTDKLTILAQGQQDWLQGLDAAQAKVRTMAEGMAALEGKITALQTALQTAAARTDADGRQRQELDAKIGQDLEAMIDTVSQLRQMQMLLQEQMTQVQKNTQSQAESLKAAIERMKQPPADVKLSEVAAKAEAPVAPTGE